MAFSIYLTEKRRKALFQKKVAALFKEARRISVSCDAKVGILIAKPGGSELIAWPSPEVAKLRFIRYLKSREAKRKRRIEKMKRHLFKKLNSLEASLAQLKKENAQSYANLLLNQMLDGGKSLQELGEEELDILLSITGEGIQHLTEKLEVMEKNAQLQSTGAGLSLLEPVSSVVAGVPVVSSTVANDQGMGASSSDLVKTNQETAVETPILNDLDTI